MLYRRSLEELARERLNRGPRVACDHLRRPWCGEIGGFRRIIQGVSRGLCAICGRRVEPIGEASSFSSELKRLSTIKTTRLISPSATRHGGSRRPRALKHGGQTRFRRSVDQTGLASRKRFHPTHASFGGRDRNRGSGRVHVLRPRIAISDLCGRRGLTECSACYGWRLSDQNEEPRSNRRRLLSSGRNPW